MKLTESRLRQIIREELGGQSVLLNFRAIIRDAPESGGPELVIKDGSGRDRTVRLLADQGPPQLRGLFANFDLQRMGKITSVYDERTGLGHSAEEWPQLTGEDWDAAAFVDAVDDLIRRYQQRMA